MYDGSQKPYYYSAGLTDRVEDPAKVDTWIANGMDDDCCDDEIADFIGKWGYWTKLDCEVTEPNWIALAFLWFRLLNQIGLDLHFYDFKSGNR